MYTAMEVIDIFGAENNHQSQSEVYFGALYYSIAIQGI